jgi:nucleotidyltransferase substrate binding protein (TIGR01987 family)
MDNQVDSDIRWKQRLANLTRAKKMLDGIQDQDITDMNYVDVAWWIHIFDLVFELSWKTLRDYMIAQGEWEEMNFTREILSAGQARGFIADGALWVDMLRDRNRSTHEYSESAAEAFIIDIKTKYLLPLDNLYVKLSKLP